MATSGAETRVVTGAQARANGERAEFTAANAHTVEQPNDRARYIAPEDYGDADGAPLGPSEEEEAAFLAEDSSSHFSGGASESPTHSSGVRQQAHVEDNEKNSGPLPSLEELRGRIAPEVLGLMEELFRAKLTRVTRVSARDLRKTNSSH